MSRFLLSCLKRTAVVCCGAVLLIASLRMIEAQPADPPNPSQAGSQQPARDLTKQPTLYVVGYAHLDTEWRWEYPQVIQEYLSKTLRNNFALFEKYPHYIFNFTGSNLYEMMKEY